MVKARGYTGSVVQLRRAVRLIRPAATATVYRRLTTLAAEDYGESAVMVSPEELTDHDGVARARATSQKPTKLVPTRWRRDPWWYQLTGTPMPEGKVLAFPKPKRAERWGS